MVSNQNELINNQLNNNQMDTLSNCITVKSMYWLHLTVITLIIKLITYCKRVIIADVDYGMGVNYN